MSRLTLVLVLAAAACGTDRTTNREANPHAASPVATPSSPPSHPQPQAGSAGSAASFRMPCSNDIDVECPPGFEIGCIGDRTTQIVCVHVGAKAVVPCANQIVLECPAGEINSCFAEPPYGKFHICVLPRK